MEPMNRRDFLETSAGFILSNAVSTAGLAGESPPGRDARPVSRTKTRRTARRTGIAHDPAFLEHWIAQGHPESPHRLVAVVERLKRDGLLERTEKIELFDDVEPHLLRIHTAGHVAAIKRRYPEAHKAASAAASAGVAATAAVCEGRLDNAFCATRPPGHHALNTGREEGFCFYNTVAVAARYAQRVHGLEKILIADWDYHHGNGTEAAFYDDPSVLFFSTHDQYAYPGVGDPRRTGKGEGKGYNVNVHLDCGATDQDLLSAFTDRLLPAAEAFKPDLVLISAGFDSRKDDTLGCFEVSDDGFAELTKMMTGLAARHCEKRLVSVLEGGYRLSGLASAAAAHVKALLENGSAGD